jgi:hypothetical protein
LYFLNFAKTDQKIDSIGPSQAVQVEQPEMARAENQQTASASAPSRELDRFNLQLLNDDFDRVTEHAKRKRAKQVPQKQPPSKLDRRIFDLKPENKIVSRMAQDILGMHFLDVNSNDQQLIRELVAEQEIVENGEAKRLKEQEQLKKQEFLKRTTPAARPGNGRVKQKQKELKRYHPNLRFSDTAIERLLDYEAEQKLYFSFLDQFELLNGGNIAAKHHVPDTSPRVFQKDCGGAGKVYYRKRDGQGGIFIELIGEKAWQEQDYKLLQSS